LDRVAYREDEFAIPTEGITGREDLEQIENNLKQNLPVPAMVESKRL
jgi:hypothetical protein